MRMLSVLAALFLAFVSTPARADCFPSGGVALGSSSLACDTPSSFTTWAKEVWLPAALVDFSQRSASLVAVGPNSSLAWIEGDYSEKWGPTYSALTNPLLIGVSSYHAVTNDYYPYSRYLSHAFSGKYIDKGYASFYLGSASDIQAQILLGIGLAFSREGVWSGPMGFSYSFVVTLTACDFSASLSKGCYTLSSYSEDGVPPVQYMPVPSPVAGSGLLAVFGAFIWRQRAKSSNSRI